MALLSFALVAAGCTATAEEGPDEDASAESGTEPATPVADGPIELLQDVWIITRIRAVSGDGQITEVLPQVIDELTAEADEPRPLGSSFSFAPLPGLAAAIVDDDEVRRTDIDVTAGLLGVNEGVGVYERDDGVALSTLVVLATAPVGPGHVAPGDSIYLELFGLAALQDSPVALVDHLFGHTLPDPDAADDAGPLDAVALFGARLADGRLTLGGPEGGAEDELGIRVGAPFERAGTDGAIAEAAWGPPIGHQDGEPRVVLASGVDGPDASTPDGVPHVREVAFDGVGGIMPAKAQGPVAAAVIGSIACAVIGGILVPPAAAGIAIGCTLFSVGGVAITTFPTLMKENLDPDPPDPWGCLPPCGTSWGDPHLTSFTGRRFDVQAAGEFTALASADGEIVIQARMEPVGSNVAANTAVAVALGDHSVTVDARRDHLVSLDGEVLELGATDVVDLPDGSQIARHGTAVTLTWPDGTGVQVVKRRSTVDYRISLAEARVGSVMGLHGDGDGPLTDADGVEFPRQPSDDELRSFVDSWRITTASSHFDYEAGASTETYTDRSFPAARASLGTVDPDARAWATVLCTGAGLLDDDLADCTLDVASTGWTGFVQSAIENQAILHPERFQAHLLVDALTAIAAPEDDDAPFAWTHIEEAGLVHGTGSPLIANEETILLLRDEDGAWTLTALSVEDGTERWSRSALSSCRPVFNGHGAVVAMEHDADGALLLLDEFSGEVLDRLASPDLSRSCTLGLTSTADGLVLQPQRRAGTSGDAAAIHAISTRDGLEVAWVRTLDANHLGYAPTDGERIYVLQRLSGESLVRQLDPETGEDLGQATVGIATSSGEREASLVPLADGLVAVSGRTGRGNSPWGMVVLDAEAGMAERWSLTFSRDLGVTSPFPRLREVDGAMVGWSGDVVASIASATGEVQWTTPVGGLDGRRGAVASPPEGGAIVTAFSGPRLVGVDRDGEVAWTLESLPGWGAIEGIGPVVAGGVLVQAERPDDAGGGTVLGLLPLPPP